MIPPIPWSRTSASYSSRASLSALRNAAGNRGVTSWPAFSSMVIFFRVLATQPGSPAERAGAVAGAGVRAQFTPRTTIETATMKNRFLLMAACSFPQ
jgi:hypothetical protein